jgi:hypothetical protein
MMGWKMLNSKKKERRRKCDRPSSMGLSEEGPLVSCIDPLAGNRSNFSREYIVE